MIQLCLSESHSRFCMILHDPCLTAIGVVFQDGGREHRNCNIPDWWLFGIGFFTGITWLIGAFLPYCRNPRHPTPSHRSAHLANGIMAVILVIVIIIAVGFAARNGRDYYNGNCCGGLFSGASCLPC